MHEISVTWAILVIYELIGRIQRLQRLKHKQMSELKMCVLIMPEDMLFYGEIWQKNYTAAGSDKSQNPGQTPPSNCSLFLAKWP